MWSSGPAKTLRTQQLLHLFAIYKNSGSMKVGFSDSSGAVFGVANEVTIVFAFAAVVTDVCHRGI